MPTSPDRFVLTAVWRLRVIRRARGVPGQCPGGPHPGITSRRSAPQHEKLAPRPHRETREQTWVSTGATCRRDDEASSRHQPKGRWVLLSTKRGGLMSHTQRAAQGGPGDARIIEEHHITGPHGEDEIEGTRTTTDGAGTTPSRSLAAAPTSLGFNSTWWMAVAWIVLILLLVFPLALVVVREERSGFEPPHMPSLGGRPSAANALIARSGFEPLVRSPHPLKADSRRFLDHGAARRCIARS